MKTSIRRVTRLAAAAALVAIPAAFSQGHEVAHACGQSTVRTQSGSNISVNLDYDSCAVAFGADGGSNNGNFVLTLWGYDTSGQLP